ncbi:glycosyltransferase [Bacteroides sp.]|uniref:glycosyltransferase n=1 Tax=Bacteroides sp. TaxID=29523 RepID=UPI002A7EF623|nr:glycosyltransferase [Bacteroides sp.]
MAKPLVSVVIPVYNMEEFLEETLDSVLSSDYPNFEVIVMDDGSKDRSFEIAESYKSRYENVRVYTQANSGVATARNHAISKAGGVYILPVDADNRISKELIHSAVDILESDPEVKVVCPRAEFFGDRSGEWVLPPFSLSLLARKNMMDTCAVYRKSEWERIGGYCAEIVAREDWEFWISMLKDGGKVVKLPEIGLFYRVREQSKRVTDRLLKKHVIDVLNRRHPDFFERELGGPLRYQRSWSRLINRISRIIHPRRVFVGDDFQDLSSFVRVLPVHFENGGTLIYEGRNKLKEFEIHGRKLIVKSYQLPHLINRIVYNSFRASKARRSYQYAQMLRKAGIGSPAPVGFYSTGTWLLFGRSYFVSLKSECPYTYRNLLEETFTGDKEKVLRAIARTTAALHENGFLHKDYSGGNILFRETDKGIEVEIIDLNRMRFGKVDIETGCKNFERLPGTHEMFVILADEYAKVRGFDADRCLELIEKSHL